MNTDSNDLKNNIRVTLDLKSFKQIHVIGKALSMFILEASIINHLAAAAVSGTS